MLAAGVVGVPEPLVDFLNTLGGSGHGSGAEHFYGGPAAVQVLECRSRVQFGLVTGETPNLKFIS